MHFCQQMNKSRHVRLVKICMAVWNVACLSHRCHHCWNGTTTASLCSHPLFGLCERLFGLHKCSVNECQWVPFFPHGGIQRHPFASSALPYQMPFCQIAPLLPSVMQQQHVMEYWWDIQPLLPYQRHLPLMLWANVITFRAPSYVISVKIIFFSVLSTRCWC